VQPFTTYKDEHLALAPSWLRGRTGEAWLRAEGDAKDAFMQRARYGVRARFISVAPSDALPAIGEERQLARGPTDTDATYAARLVAAWDLWLWAGTPTGILRALGVLGYWDVYLVTATGRAHTMNSAGVLTTTQNTGGSFLFAIRGWNRYALIFPALPAAWGGVVPGNTSPEANAVRQTLAKWAPAHMILDSIRILVSGRMWGFPFTQNWGAGGATWGGSVTSWTP